MRWLLPALVACSAGSSSKPAASVDVAIRDVRVFDGTRVLEHQTVLVANGRIVAIDRAGALAGSAAARDVDGRGATLLPGLIDAHTHVMDEDNARAALDVGVMTEIDMMSAPTISVPLAREATDRARVVPAGFAATAPGGHGTEYGMVVPTLTKPEEADAFVAARVKEGSHHLKIIIESGAEFAHPLPTLDAATVRALVDAAHRRHLLAVAHVGAPADVAVALAGGVDALVHAPAGPLDDATIQTIADRHMFVVPTLSVLASLCGKQPGAAINADPHLAPMLDPATQANLKASFGFSLDGAPCAAPAAIVAALRARHVAILAGTDAPNPGTAHGASLHGELALLVAAGLTPTEALAAATSVPAKAFALPDVGEIRAGAIADLVLVAGDPTTDITATRAIKAVWRGGHALDLDARRTAIATASASDHAEKIGALADFERDTDKPTARFGRIGAGSDGIMGGTSTSTVALVDGGAHGSARALAVTGTVAAGPAPWAGVSFVPAASGFDPVDLSSLKRLTFSVRGDGKTYAVMLWSERGAPPTQTFVAPREWTDVTIELAGFHAPLDSVRVITWAATQPGAFAFQIDHVAFE